MRVGSITIGGFLAAWLLVQGTRAQDGEAISPTVAAESGTVPQWIAGLESDSYSARVRATEQLVRAGQAAIAPLVAALEQGGLETIERGVYVLRQLSLAAEDPQTQQAAYGALVELAERRFTAASRRAAAAVLAIQEQRYQQAQLYLSQRGAIFGVTGIPVALGIPLEYPSVTLGPSWRGTAADIERLRWITEYRPVGGENRLMLILSGEQINDEVLQQVSQLTAISALRIDSARISNQGLATVATLPKLEVLEVLYTQVDDACIESLAQMKQASRFRLIGNRISADGTQTLRERLGQAEIDFRSGGFLGVSCLDNPCRIRTVQPNSAAARAGLRVNDVIVRYNGAPVATMEELTQQISRHGVGEKIQLEVMRDNLRVEAEIELGKWE